MDLYADNILDHYRHPRGQEPLADPSVTHEEENLSCGDQLRLSLRIADGVIDAVSWSGTGCAISQAAMSMVSEELAGKTCEEAMAMTPDTIHALLGVPVGPRRVTCALLCLHTLKNALLMQKGEEVQGWNQTVSLN